MQKSSLIHKTLNMRIVISAFVLLMGSVLYAQNNKPETIYIQIPPVPEELVCENADNYSESIALIDSLSAQLDRMKRKLNEVLKTKGDETYNTLSAGFPTEEELKNVEKLSEAEQRAFWKKMEDKQTQIEKTIVSNSLKYQTEKEALHKKLADYQEGLLTISEEYSEAHYNAMKAKSDKRQKIYDTCIENNSLNEN